MQRLTVNAKGRVTLGEDILTHLGVQPGEKIAMAKLPDGRIELRATRDDRSISNVFGLLKTDDGPTLSIDEINEVIAKAWAAAGTTDK